MKLVEVPRNLLDMLNNAISVYRRKDVLGFPHNYILPWPTRSKEVRDTAGDMRFDAASIFLVPLIVGFEQKSRLKDTRLPQFLRYMQYFDLVVLVYKNENTFKEAVKLLKHTKNYLNDNILSKLIIGIGDIERDGISQGIVLLPSTNDVIPSIFNYIPYKWFLNKIVNGSVLRKRISIQNIDIAHSLMFREYIVNLFKGLHS